MQDGIECLFGVLPRRAFGTGVLPVMNDSRGELDDQGVVR